MSAFANPVFPWIDPTSNRAGSALNRISRLEYAVAKNAPTTPLESALTKLLDLKSFRFRSYKKHPGGPLPLGLTDPAGAGGGNGFGTGCCAGVGPGQGKASGRPNSGYGGGEPGPVARGTSML